MCHALFILGLIERHLELLLGFAIMNSATVNVLANLFLQMCEFWQDVYLGMELQGFALLLFSWVLPDSSPW